ncbi:uncharacterized protein LOC110619330 [Manihot esculenta]|uniref:Uncharacterized protein n=2 Tax=Manihot esculenta TaxID=3983 RepID=A0ACB7HER3_MANES|nr:uncharacterized protein LOC110619330 [Manihot esculenta]KAG8650484.1 hypothetical protein MANES_07G046900v8 [Manihot esculenta]OAY45275.1 hypothetical protein MANES_07G046900v8 [Manihot esculenta]
MENYSYNSYPDSGHSSPRSREIEFENPTPWEDQSQQQPQDFKAKFMCSYGGKIHPRPHDNQLSYIGGETKILAVDRNIKFSVMISKLAALCNDTDISFKYQLPGEDLDALISVTNDDDLEHMMHEYDRLFRASAKPARMRLFLFPVNPSPASFGSEGSKSERDRFIEALNSGPSHVPEANKPSPNNVDFLFGLEKGVPQPQPVKVPDLQEAQVGVGHDDRVLGSDQLNVQTQLQRMQIREQEQQTMYRKNSDENLVGGYPGEYYVQKLPDKLPPATLPVTVPQTMTAPAGYWPEKQFAAGGYQPAAVTVTTTPAPPEQQQVYMLPGPAPGTIYHTPVMRQVTGQPGQPYYMQRMGGPEVYREQPVYNMVPQPQQQPPPMSAAQGPMGVVRPNAAGVGVTDTGYAPVAYDSGVGRQMYYTAQGGVMQAPPQYQGVGGVAVSGEMRHVGGGGAPSQDGKGVVSKVSQSSV